MATKQWYKNNAEKMRAYRKKWYTNNKDKQKKLVVKRKMILREWFRKYKKTLKCEQCLENHPACLDFHHKISSDKVINISQFVDRYGWNKERLMVEINKCSVLCSNCHRKLHWKLKFGSVV